ncbi:MAG TPA: hypothetical protein VK638_14035 [Edaphobacter sp.]|nr:hypothetical protein [Edaphobacter sp.]
MDDLVQTPYGYVRIRTLQTLQSTFDTTELLKAVDDLDRFYAQWKRELRDDVLRVHAMAHSVINDAPLSCAPGEEGLGEIAASVADELQECRNTFTSVVSLLKQLATLKPD